MRAAQNEISTLTTASQDIPSVLKGKDEQIRQLETKLVVERGTLTVFLFNTIIVVSEAVTLALNRQTEANDRLRRLQQENLQLKGLTFAWDLPNLDLFKAQNAIRDTLAVNDGNLPPPKQHVTAPRVPNQLRGAPAGLSGRTAMVIFTYNRPEYLTRCLQKVFQHHVPEVDLFVSQDGNFGPITSVIQR